MGRAKFWPFASAAVALLGFAGLSAAHHPPRFERCQRFTFTGQLEKIEWTNPHVLLSVQTDDGVSRRVGWLNIQGLRRAGIGVDTLRIGDRLRIEGGIRKKDSGKEPILLSSIRRLSDEWEWSQPLRGC
ncbi:MAG TPA: DUF6152 family protein [Gammaproteobacteria bacterium]